MLVYGQTVQDIARRAAFQEPVRYLAPRWAELLDPATHYSRAGASLVDPLTAVGEYGATAEGFATSTGRITAPLWNGRGDSRLCYGSERNCRHWFPSEHSRLVARLGKNLLTASQTTPRHRAKRRRFADWHDGLCDRNSPRLKRDSRVPRTDTPFGYETKARETVLAPPQATRTGSATTPTLLIWRASFWPKDVTRCACASV